MSTVLARKPMSGLKLNPKQNKSSNRAPVFFLNGFLNSRILFLKFMELFNNFLGQIYQLARRFKQFIRACF